MTAAVSLNMLFVLAAADKHAPASSLVMRFAAARAHRIAHTGIWLAAGRRRGRWARSRAGIWDPDLGRCHSMPGRRVNADKG
jgi:hypothetical protein